MSHGTATEDVDPSEQQMRASEQSAKSCHNPRISGLIPCMDIRSTRLSHVAMGVAMGGLDRPVPRPTEVLHRAPASVRPARLFTLFVAFLVLAACSNSELITEPAEPSSPDGTAASDPGNSNESDPEPAEEPPGAEELASVWEAFHAAWVEQAAAEDPDPAAFEDVAADPDGVSAALTAQRGDSRLVTTEAELWPRFDIEGDSAEVADCTIVAQHPNGQPDSTATVTIGWEATAVVTEGGWRIQDARQLDLFCIAEELNDELIGAYKAFRAAKEAVWDPPDPEHPDLERTMAGEQLEFIRDLLAEHQREGIVIREPAPTDNAVVFDVGLGRATVSDCTEQVEGYGAFDVDSGERLHDLIAPVDPGRLDAQSVELERDGNGVWRVVDQAASRGTDCVIGSTRYEVS
jgi:hypothetical protein